MHACGPSKGLSVSARLLLLRPSFARLINWRVRAEAARLLNNGYIAICFRLHAKKVYFVVVSILNTSAASSIISGPIDIFAKLCDAPAARFLQIYYKK